MQSNNNKIKYIDGIMIKLTKRNKIFIILSLIIILIFCNKINKKDYNDLQKYNYSTQYKQAERQLLKLRLAQANGIEYPLLTKLIIKGDIQNKNDKLILKNNKKTKSTVILNYTLKLNDKSIEKQILQDLVKNNKYTAKNVNIIYNNALKNEELFNDITKSEEILIKSNCLFKILKVMKILIKFSIGILVWSILIIFFTGEAVSYKEGISY